MTVGVRVSSVLRTFAFASATSATLLLGAAASALAGTLDQQQTSSSSNVGMFVNVSPAQTFTAGITGGLDQADLLLCCKTGSPVEPLTVEIRNAAGGEPGTAVLASTSIPMSALGSDPAFVPATFAPPAAVTAGTQYALVAYTAHATNDCCGWNYQGATDPYSGGAALTSSTFPPQAPWTPQGAGADFAFKTYVVTPPPATATATCKGKQATQVGTAANDAITGTAGNDVIAALEGNDTVTGLGGKDLICGGAGKDTLKGDGGKDTLLGQAGKDKLRGGGAKDICKGGKGNDSGKCEVEKSL